MCFWFGWDMVAVVVPCLKMMLEEIVKQNGLRRLVGSRNGINFFQNSLPVSLVQDAVPQ
jgi:hypothetical protein